MARLAMAITGHNGMSARLLFHPSEQTSMFVAGMSVQCQDSRKPGPPFCRPSARGVGDRLVRAWKAHDTRVPRYGPRLGGAGA